MLKLGSLLLQLLPPELRAVRPAWILLASALAALTLASPVAALRSLDGASLPGLLPLILAVVVAAATLALMWLRRDLIVAAALMHAAMGVLIPATAFVGDGVGAMTLPTVAIVPMCAFFIQGPVAGQHAARWVTAVLAFAGLAVWLGGARFPTPETDRLDELFTLGATVALVWVSYAVILAYHDEQTTVLAALRSSEARNALAIDAERAGILECLGDAGECFASPRLRSLLGLPNGPNPLSTTSLLAALSPSGAEALANAFARASSRPGDRFRLETPVVVPGHPPRWIVWDGLAESTPGVHNRVVAVVHDITVERRVAQLKDDFVGNVNHELRTPLTNILGAVALLRAGVGGQIEPEGAELLALAQRNGDQLTALIGELLDVQRLEEGSLMLHLAPVDVSAICRAVVADLAGFADQRGVSVALTTEGPCIVTTDARRLTQVVRNLLHNAGKFSASGATVTVRVRFVGSTIRVEVIDEGPGIPEEFQAHVFGRFAQASSGTSRPQGGTGLGLSLARGLMERLGGGIGFVSVAGQGTCFWVELPAAPATYRAES